MTEPIVLNLATLKELLEKHPGLLLISRERAGEYASAAKARHQKPCKLPITFMCYGSTPDINVQGYSDTETPPVQAENILL